MSTKNVYYLFRLTSTPFVHLKKGKQYLIGLLGILNDNSKMELKMLALWKKSYDRQAVY